MERRTRVRLIGVLVRLNAFFSFAPDCCDERKKRKRRSAAAVPGERLLIESDAPYLLPPEDKQLAVLRSESAAVYNHPINVISAFRELVWLRGQEPALLERTLCENARRLLGPLGRVV